MLLCAGYRPRLYPALGPGDRPRLGGEDRAVRHFARGALHRRLRGGDRRLDTGVLLPLSGGSGPAGLRPRHPFPAHFRTILPPRQLALS